MNNRLTPQYIAIAATLLFVAAILIISLYASRSNMNIVDPYNISLFEDSDILVADVIDGDTIELVTGDRVRYIGIDAPELDQTDLRHECYAEEATERNRQLVGGKSVWLRRDVSNRDEFGRLLRFVYVEDEFVNDILVREGYARAVPHPPDTNYHTLFAQAEEEARFHVRGLWDTCL